jgi:predicted phosphoribosyltransferase
MRSGLLRDRREAGRQLAEKLTAYANRPDVLVLALPRGGVPVAYEVARTLGAPLDVFVVRKLGVPGYEELAMGAVATGGVRVLNDQLVERLGIPAPLIDAVAARESQELARRERLYRGGRPPPDVGGRTVILVDDGLATGATMHAARIVQARSPRETSHLYRVRTQARRSRSKIGKVEAGAPGNARCEVGNPVATPQHVLRHACARAAPGANIASGA